MAYSEAFAKSGERGLVPTNYLRMGLQTAKTRENMFRHLFDQRKLPVDGWSDQTIEILLHELSAMDSNNFLSKAGVGEREGRIFSEIVSRRHYGMVHGIGRSGDLAEAQPKAAGSSLLATLTNALVLDFLRTFVSSATVAAAVFPMATGMTISLCLQTFKTIKREADFVIWSRIDQKSCLKAILAAGCIPIVVDPVVSNGLVLETDIKTIERHIMEKGTESILCIITTTSCFAPRATDDVQEVAELCKSKTIFHLINNAYGVQSSRCCRAIHAAQKSGGVDVFIQSTDKNLMVPVGGAIVGSFNKDVLSRIQKSYPGRASSSQSLDVFVTLLSMGMNGYKRLLELRTSQFEYLRGSIVRIALKYNEDVWFGIFNDISIGMSLKCLTPAGHPTSFPSQLGSMLFTRNVQGARVVVPGESLKIGPVLFKGWGSHGGEFPYPYLTAAASIGMTKEDVDFFIKKLDESLFTLTKNTRPVTASS